MAGIALEWPLFTDLAHILEFLRFLPQWFPTNFLGKNITSHTISHTISKCALDCPPCIKHEFASTDVHKFFGKILPVFIWSWEWADALN